MPSYNATLDLTTDIRDLAGEPADQILNQLRGHHAVITSHRGHGRVILTLPAPDIATAALRAHRLAAGLPITRSTFQTTTDFDHHNHTSHG